MAALPVTRVIALAAVLAVAAGCAGSGYTYHSNRDEKLYFKVPDDWTVFDTADLLPEAAGDAGGGWVRGFAGGNRPSPDAVRAITHSEPRGYVEIIPLDVMERDELSLATLRSTNFGTDPLLFAQENPGGPLEILDYHDIVLDAGPHGVRIQVAITPEDGGGTAIIDQTVLVDKATTKRYVLSIGCSVECWDAHHNEIEEVIESWTLEEK
jgi:hypothetical protein